MAQKKLRFAPIIRVSTEQQKDKGESLNVQRKRIKRHVDMIGGTIPENCWQYVGQEHATPEHERRKLDQLLKDSSKDKFDAVIVVDASRWSRDNKRSKEGLEILRQNGIKFFVGTMEFNLWDASHALYIGMTTEINEFLAKEQTRKSVESRIERLQNGRPATGKLPFGRTWSEKEGWGIDPEKKRMAEDAAKRYLAGEKMKDIALSYGRNKSGLFKALKERCGNQWEVNFNVPKLNINTTVKVAIPRILPDETIEAIHRQADKNKTYNGKLKSDNLLSKYIYCSACGCNMHSSTPQDTRYYRHAYEGKAGECENRGYVHANELEAAVLAHLKTTLGNPEKVRKAIERANPDPEGQKRLEREAERLKKELKGLERDMSKLVKLTINEVYTEEEVKPDRDKIREQKDAKMKRLQTVEGKLSNRPTSEQTKRLSKLAARVGRDATRRGGFDKMSFKEARKLVEQTFDGKDQEGRDLGVYVTWKEDKNYEIELRGIVEKTLLSFPLDDDTLIELYNLDSEYCDVEAELKKIRKSIDQYTWQSPTISIIMENKKSGTTLIPPQVKRKEKIPLNHKLEGIIISKNKATFISGKFRLIFP